MIGCEYATIFSTMGSKVYLINRGTEILNFIDQEIVKEFLEIMQHDGIDLLFNKSIKSIKPPATDKDKVEIILESGEVLHVDMFLFAAGRNGRTKDLNLQAVGIKTTNRETIEVNPEVSDRLPQYLRCRRCHRISCTCEYKYGPRSSRGHPYVPNGRSRGNCKDFTLWHLYRP